MPKYNWWETAGLTDAEKFQLAPQPDDRGLLDVASLFPFLVGDVASGLLAVKDFGKGDYLSAGLNSIGLLPFVPALGGVIAKNIPSKTQFETAQEIAQRNASLPVSKGGLGLPANNTAMDRAKAMGFDTKNMWFRGDSPNLSEFNVNDPSTYVQGNIFLTNEKPIASWYARTGQPRDIMDMPNTESEGVYSLFTKNNPKELKINANESWADIPVPKNFRDVFWRGRGQIDDVAAEANKRGYPSAIFKNVYDQYGLGHQKVIFNPSDIRSVNAAFDPFRRNESDILAGMVAAPVGLLAVDKEKEKKKNSK